MIDCKYVRCGKLQNYICCACIFYFRLNNVPSRVILKNELILLLTSWIKTVDTTVKLLFCLFARLTNHGKHVACANSGKKAMLQQSQIIYCLGVR
jgi:hypothetical protein